MRVIASASGGLCPEGNPAASAAHIELFDFKARERVSNQAEPLVTLASSAQKSDTSIR